MGHFNETVHRRVYGKVEEVTYKEFNFRLSDVAATDGLLNHKGVRIFPKGCSSVTIPLFLLEQKEVPDGIEPVAMANIYTEWRDFLIISIPTDDFEQLILGRMVVDQFVRVYKDDFDSVRVEGLYVVVKEKD